MKKGVNKNKIASFAAYLYIICLFILLFVARDRLVKTDYRQYYNIRPLVKIFHYNWANQHYRWLYYLEIVSNMVVYFPFATALIVIFKRIKKKGVIAALLLTPVVVELLQYILALGVFDIDDIILNVTGGFIGYMMYLFWLRKYDYVCARRKDF